MTNEALFNQLIAIETDDCVLWPKGRYRQGYGAAKIDGRMVAVHREALLQRVGPPPAPKMDACHRPAIGCQRHCLNYRHLRWDTRTANSLDSIIDGSRPLNDSHYRTRLSAADVRAIRSSNARVGELALQFGVDSSHISKIRAGTRRRYV